MALESLFLMQYALISPLRILQPCVSDVYTISN